MQVTHDISKYCKAAVFSKVGKQTPLAVRFSTVSSAGGSGGYSLIVVVGRWAGRAGLLTPPGTRAASR